MQIGFGMNDQNINSELSWSNTFDENIDIINSSADIDEFNIKNNDLEKIFSDPNTKCICIEDIMKENLNNLTTNEILQYECSIAYFIQALFGGVINNKLKSNKNYDNDLTFEKIESIIEYLQWISNACIFLAKKIGQEIIPFKCTDPPTIIRSSYNFCSMYTHCKNFYSKQQEPTCTEHHYVHSLLRNNIESLIEYLNYVNKNNLPFNKEKTDNINMSIKTICFVTRHMAKEISYIDDITKKNSELFHRNNPINVNKKKSTTKSLLDGFKIKKSRECNNSNSSNFLPTLQHNTNIKPDSNVISQKNNNNRLIKNKSHKKTKLIKSNKKNIQNHNNNIFSSLKIEN